MTDAGGVQADAIVYDDKSRRRAERAGDAAKLRIKFIV